MGAKLRVLQAAAEPVEMEIGNTATIGRSRDSTVCLNTNPLASRQHAMIRCHNGFQYQIIDLGSRNGTYINDQRVVTPVTLENGSRIRIGESEIIFTQEEVAGDDEALAVTMAGTIGTAEQSVREVALLLCDIRGFSTMAEKMPSSDVAQMLGAWFREAGNVIQRSGGTIDKFIGDAMLAYWTKRETGPTESEMAFEAGKQILDLAGTITWPVPATHFDVVVALHRGTVSCSNIGLVAQRDATIIGDTVNTVFRIEPLMKELGQRMVMSRDFLDGLREAPPVVDLGDRALKGKRQAVQLFAFR
ncbi:MAG: adenylate/guanylate cyclase domain-containing protein [Verrucomicrobiota bacterium]